MAIVTNYSDLSPAMRAALIDETTTRHGTAEALVKRNLVSILPSRNSQWPLELTEAGRRAQEALREPEKAAPAKVSLYLEKADKLGLEVTETQRAGAMRSWTISSPNPIDNSQLWVFWTPSARGGRLALTTYWGPHSKPRRDTRRGAFITLDMMGESLQRHLERQAVKDEEEAQRIAGTLTVAEIEAARTDLFEDGRYPARVAVYTRALEIKRATTAPRDEEEELAEAAGLTVAQLRERTDPTRPGWFEVGQGVQDNRTDKPVYHQIIGVHQSGDRVEWVAVSTNGGFGRKPIVYGDHPEAVGTLADLETAGFRPHERRAWPRLRSAQEGIRLALIDQQLTGWARGMVDPERVVVNIPDGTDPTRHLVLLRRYCPYRAKVTLLAHPEPHRNSYPMIVVTPLEER